MVRPEHVFGNKYCERTSKIFKIKNLFTREVLIGKFVFVQVGYRQTNNSTIAVLVGISTRKLAGVLSI